MDRTSLRPPGSLAPRDHPEVPSTFGVPDDPTLDEVASELQQALTRKGWNRAVALIGEHWPILLDEPSHILDRALRSIPLRAFDDDVRAAAVRDIRLHSSADAVDRMLGNVGLPDPDDLSEIEAVARSKRALSLLSVTSSRMIAFRVRGRMARAIQLATLVERLGRIAVVHQPALITTRLPAALLHAGITRGLSDDLPGAIVCLKDAYERGPVARGRYVERDAAGKLALFHSLAGDIEHARVWLDRHDLAPEVRGWYRPRVSLSADIARSLIATESLDEQEARSAVRSLEQPVNAEQSWGAAVTYARSRYSLAWGDRLGAVAQVKRDRNRYADWLGESSTLGPLLILSEVDLLLSVGKLRRAQGVIDQSDVHDDHPVTLISRGRVALFNGDSDESGRLATTVLDQTVPTRTRVDALTLYIAAEESSRRSRSTSLALEHLNDAVREQGLALPALALSAKSQSTLSALQGEHGARDLFIDGAHRVRLTAQQQLVLDGLQDGLNLREIADRTHLSANTIKTHSKALYRRLGASSKDEVLTRAREAGLLAHD